MARQANYDNCRGITAGQRTECTVGWEAIASQLAGARIVCVECYPGARVEEIEAELTARMRPDAVFCASDALPNLLRRFVQCSRLI